MTKGKKALPRPGLPLTYRQAEISKFIAPCLRAGDSCSVVGVSGMAKSNMFRHLLEPEVRRRFLGEDWGDYLFVGADVNALGRISEDALYEHLTRGLLAGSRPARRRGRHPPRGPEPAAARREGDGPALGFDRAVGAAIASSSRRVVFLFDQFDEIYKSLPPYLFAKLRAVRDEHKYRISYVLFTREELPYLCRAPECEEFYELLSSNVLGLGPYGRDDAHLLLDRVGGRYGRRLSRAESERLVSLSGGHPGILKAVCMTLLHGKIGLPWAGDEAVEKLLLVDDVRSECEKIWRGISDGERAGLSTVILGGTSLKLDAETERRLRLKRLIYERGGEVTTLCPLFTRYVSGLKTEHRPGVRIQAGPIRVDMSGETWVGEQRITPPLTKKESSLLEYLCLEAGRLRTKDEIVAVVYPEVYAAGDTVSDDAINALVRRLRERIEPPSGGLCRLTTTRGKGYRLEIPFTP